VAHLLTWCGVRDATGNNGFRERILTTIFNRNQETIVADSVGPISSLSETDAATEEAPAEAKAHESFKVYGVQNSTGENAHFSTLSWMILFEPVGVRADPMKLQPEPQQNFQPLSQPQKDAKKVQKSASTAAQNIQVKNEMTRKLVESRLPTHNVTGQLLLSGA
jgi:hypothetical protein